MQKILISLLLLGSQTLAATKIVIDSNEKSSSSIEELEKLSSDYSFQETTRVELPNGEIRVKNQEYYKGIPVWDGSIVTKDNKIS